MKRSEIHLRDPFVLAENGIYYLYGTRGYECWGDVRATGLDVYQSTDLTEWVGPTVCFTPPEDFWADRHFWAPEVHRYKGSYYMFVSFKSEHAHRGTQILKADSPLGPFLPHSDGPVTPRNWECLDGTLYLDHADKPYLVFCHEWVQIKDGAICVLPLSADLKKPIGEPTVLFHASDPTWADKGKQDYVTDGPFLYRTQNGRLIMLWSTSYRGAYCEALSYSLSGEITGPWVHDDRVLFEKDGGHGMIFTDFAGKLRLVLHRPNRTAEERPHFFEIIEKDNSLYQV